MYRVVLNKQAVKDQKKLKASGLSEKAKRLVAIVGEDPFQTSLSHEGLVGNFAGLYSRRINLKHRFVYRVIDEPITIDGMCYDGAVIVVSMWSHCGELR